MLFLFSRYSCNAVNSFLSNLTFVGVFGDCECDIETNIIASHIHRIIDIYNSALADEEKRRQAVDADNGFWLCANHDKMFEYGVISFDKNGDLIVNSSLEKHQLEFINYITTITKIKDAYITPNLLVYLEIHNKRVSL